MLYFYLCVFGGTVDLERVEKMNGGDGGEVAAAPPAGPPPPLEWKFSQVFGERTAGEEVQEGTAQLI